MASLKISSILKSFLFVIAMSVYTSANFNASADGKDSSVILTPVPTKDDPNRPRPHMPARHITAYYADGVLTIPSWPYTDEAAHIDITDADGTTIAAVDCAGAEMAAGVAIGSFGGSFTIVITLTSGTVLTGTF